MKETNNFAEGLGSYQRILGAVIVFSIAINVLMFVGPLYMLQVYDRVLQSRNEVTLLMITLIALGMLTVYGILEFVRSRVLVRAGLQFDQAVANPLFHKVVKGTLAAPGGGTQYALNDIDRLREFLTGSGLIAFCDAPWVPVFLAICYIFHPLLFAVAAVGALIILILAILNELLTKKTLDEAQTKSQSAQHFASTTLQNVEVIHAMGMERPLRENWNAQHTEMLGLQAKASDRAGALQAMSKFVRMSLQVGILGTGAYLALRQEISPGMMIAASIMMGRALAPVDQVVGQWKQFVNARQSYARLKSLFKSVPSDAEKTELPAPVGKIEVAGLVTVIPGTRNTILQGIEFTIEIGEVLAVLGASGAGKSSLARSLVGVWEPAAGSVRIDGSEIGHFNSEDLGKHIGYLPQDTELFAGTIAQNIARFEDADDEEIILAAERAGAHEMIKGFPDGYDTLIGSAGRRLSGGQSQRVGLARALFRDPPIVVLDEPNANLDTDGEAALMLALTGMKERSRTVVIISHKANLLGVTDKALILSQGRMQAFGLTKDIFKPVQAAPQATIPVVVPSARKPQSAGKDEKRTETLSVNSPTG